MNMKGKNRFTAAEAAAIRGLLAKIRRADRPEQKKLRGKLRREYRFYITDFDTSGGGFDVADFNELIARGVITVYDEVPRP